MNRRRQKTLAFLRYSLFFGSVLPFAFMLVFTPMRAIDAAIASAAVALVSAPSITWLFLGVIPFTRRLPFLAAILVQVGFLLAVGVAGFAVSIAVVGSIRSRLPLWSGELWGVTWGLMTGDLVDLYPKVGGFALVFLIGSQVSRKLGPGVLWNWVLGRYHRPREETRIFMFLDLKDSTSLAESLGNVRFSALVQEFFADLAHPLQVTEGGVSHYIGDEAVIVWAPERGFKKANCIRLFFEMQRELEERDAVYQRKFGVSPKFKAGVHMGTVVSAEVGASKSEIVYHGDAVNTAARVVGLCAPLGHDFLVSAPVVEALGAAPGYRFVSLGEQELKGKAEPLEVFAVEAGRTT